MRVPSKNLGSLYVGIKADVDQLKKDLNKAEKVTKKSAGVMQKAFDKINFKALGVAAAAFAGVVAVGMKKAIDAASDLNEEISKTKAVFGAQSAAMLAWSRTSVTAFGLSQRAALQNASSLGNMFKQLGATGDAAVEASTKMVELASDITSFHNVAGGAEAVLEAMAAAFRGEYDALQRYIPTINAAAVQHEALSMTGKKAAKELTFLEKALAAQAIIMRDAGDAVGDFAKTYESVATQQRLIPENIENISAKIGEKLLPVYGEWLLNLNEILTKNPEIIDDLGEIAKKTLEWAGEIAKVAIGFGGVIVKLDDILNHSVWDKMRDFVTLKPPKWLKELEENYEENKKREPIDIGEVTVTAPRPIDYDAEIAELNAWIKKDLAAREKAVEAAVKLSKAKAEAWTENKKLEQAMNESRVEELEKDREAAEELAEIEADKHEILLYYTSTELENRDRLIEKNRDYVLSLTKDLETIAKIHAHFDNLRGESFAQELGSGSGSKEAPRAFVAEWEMAIEMVEDLFTSLYSDLLRGEVESFSDYMENVHDALEDFMIETVSRMVSEWTQGFLDIEKAASQATPKIEVDVETKESGGSSGMSGGYAGIITMAWSALNSYQDKRDSKKDAERAAKEAAKIAAYEAHTQATEDVRSELERNSDALDDQLLSTNKWTRALEEASNTYVDALEAIRLIPDQYGNVAEPASVDLSLEDQALVNYFNELALVVRDVSDSLESFMRSLEAMSQTAYEAKMAEVTDYYEDMAEAAKLLNELPISVASSLESLESTLSLYKANVEEARAGGTPAGTPILDWSKGQQTVEYWQDKVAEIEAALSAYDGLLSTFDSDLSGTLAQYEEDYQKALELVEEYFLDARNEVKEGIGSFMKELTGHLSEMELAIQSTDQKFQNLQETMEDLGGSSADVRLIQLQWVRALTSIAESEIFDKFEDNFRELALLQAQSGGQSTQDYYLGKYQSSMAEGNWISASEYLEEWYSAQREAAELWDSVADSVETLVDNIQGLIDSIKYGSLNVALPETKAAAAAQDYVGLKAAAMTGGQKEIEEFINFASTYLQLSQDTMKSSAEYQTVYAGVMADLVSFQDQLLAGDYDQLIYDELSSMDEALNSNLLMVGDELNRHLEDLTQAFEENFVPEEYAGFADGGISYGPSTGYLAKLHGTEAVIPLKNGGIGVNLPQQPVDVKVYIGNDQLDAYIIRQADTVRVKTSRRSAVGAQRLF